MLVPEGNLKNAGYDLKKSYISASLAEFWTDLQAKEVFVIGGQ